MDLFRSGINKRPWRVGMAQGALPPSPPKPMLGVTAGCLMNKNGRFFYPAPRSAPRKNDFNIVGWGRGGAWGRVCQMGVYLSRTGPLARCYVVAKGLCHRKQMLRTHVVCMHVFACVCACVCVRVVVDAHVRARARLCAHICCELACLQ